MGSVSCQMPDRLYWIALSPDGPNAMARVVFEYHDDSKNEPVTFFDASVCRWKEDLNTSLEIKRPDLTYWEGREKRTLKAKLFTNYFDNTGKRLFVSYEPRTAGAGVLFSEVPGKSWERLDTEVPVKTAKQKRSKKATYTLPGAAGEKPRVYPGEFLGEYGNVGNFKIILLGGCPTALVLDGHDKLMQEVTYCRGVE